MKVDIDDRMIEIKLTDYLRITIYRCTTLLWNITWKLLVSTCTQQSTLIKRWCNLTNILHTRYAKYL